MFQQYVVPHDFPIATRLNVSVTNALTADLGVAFFDANPLLASDSVLFKKSITGGSASSFSALSSLVRMDDVLQQNQNVAFSYAFSLTASGANVANFISPFLIGFEQSSPSLNSNGILASTLNFCLPLSIDSLVTVSGSTTVSAQGVVSVPARPNNLSNAYFVGVAWFSIWQPCVVYGGASMRAVLRENTVFQPLK